MSVSFGRTTQNSFPPGRQGQQSRIQRRSARCRPGAPERKEAVNLLMAVRGAAGEVKVHAVLDRLGVGDRHEAHAGGRVLVGQPTPASRTGSGRADRERQRRCGGVGRACRQYARHAGPHLGNPLVCRGRADHRRSRHAIASRSCDQPDPGAAREPSQLSAWPYGKIITESNRILAYLCKISAAMGGLERKRG